MATFNLFDDFGDDLGREIHNFAAPDSLILMLLPSAGSGLAQTTNSVYTDLTQIANGNGYTVFTGTETTHELGGVSWTETAGGSGVWRLNSTPDEIFTAVTGSIATFRYIVMVNNSAPANEVIGYLDYGSDVIVTVGNTFTVDVGANGWFELTIPNAV